ncbi:hypothetical protein ACFL3F_00360 [Planctomycetota bacterium]
MRITHLVSTLWFVLCAGFILIVALRQAGLNWWFIFSLSGHSALVVFLLISVYLFALFRGVNRGPACENEHPLTSSSYYMFFYVVAPLLGGGAGLLGNPEMLTFIGYAQGVALGTFIATFAVWVLIDPTVALIESMLPGPRSIRLRRIAQQKAMRQERQRRRERLLSEIAEREASDREHWQEVLGPGAEELATLLTTDYAGYQRAERRAIEIGISAWRRGGIGCMRRLHEMAIEEYGQKQKRKPADYIVNWWDGIGAWRT